MVLDVETEEENVLMIVVNQKMMINHNSNNKILKTRNLTLFFKFLKTSFNIRERGLFQLSFSHKIFLDTLPIETQFQKKLNVV